MGLRRRVAELEAEKKEQLSVEPLLQPVGEEVLRLLAQIYDAASQPFAATNDEGKIIVCNQAYCRLTGRSQQELYNQDTFWDITPPEWHNFEHDLLLQLQRTHLPVRYQKEYRRPDGTTVPIELFVSCLTNREGRTLFFGFISDLSDQRKIEEELMAANSQLRAIFQAMPDFYFVLDKDGIILDYHASQESDLYTPPANFMGKPMQAVLPPDVGRQFDKAIQKVNVDKTIVVIDYMLPILGKEKFFEARLIAMPKEQIFAVARDMTERVEAGIEIRKNEAKFRLLYDEAPNGYQSLDDEGKIIDVNKAWLDITGYEKEEVIARWFGDFLPADQIPHFQKCFNELKQTNEIQGSEFHIRRRDRAVITISMDGRACYDEEGTFKQAHCTIRDVTEHKRVEDRLHKLSQAVEQSPATVVITDTAGNIEYANPRFSQLTGYTAEEVHGKNHRILKSGHMNPAAYKSLWDTILAGEEWQGEFHNQKKNGELYWEKASISPIRNSAGEIISFLKVGEDITETRRALDELRAAEAMFRTLVEQSLAAIYIMQGNRWRYVNPRFAEILGYSPEEIINTKLLHDIVAEEDHALLDENIRKRLTGEIPSAHYFIHLRCKDGSSIEVEALGSRTDFEGQPAIIGTLLDITERKKMEEEILKARKLESVGLLAGGIAHDFNNMLTTIFGNISLAKLSVSAGNQAMERLVEAEKACLRAKDLTHQLLTFAKGGAPIKGLVSIADIIHDSATFALSGSKARCEFLLPDDLWSVEVDIGQISQVIQNLVINADQAMPAGGLIRIQAENAALTAEDILPLPEGNYIKIAITDQGIGIPPENLNKIFDPYFSTKRKGNGLGLAITYSIIKQHDGLIRVESLVGIGTTFYIYLPASGKAITSGPDINQPAGKATGKILVMDDEPAIRLLMERMLGDFGYEVGLAEDGESAIKLYSEAKDLGEPFIAVLLDLTIPGEMGGVEVIGKLRQLAPDLPAIASSGYSNDPVISNYRKYGFNGAIAKPYSMEDLRRVLQAVLPNNSSPSAANLR
jgi:two-component system, cell cycle sensor histidine kinase and response regulator CckA